MQQWVPEDQRDTRWYLWNKLFTVRVPFMATMSADYIRHHGVPFTGYAEADRSTHAESVTRMMSINQMVEFFARGTTVAVVRAADTAEMYQYISNHLQAWRRELEVSLDIRNAPLDDLKLLDRFANAVYVHAQSYFTDEIVESLLAKRIGSTMRVTRSSILGKPRQSTLVTKIGAIEEKPEEYTPKKRDSLADVFASHEIAAKPKWK
jgi:hypothetical protein